MADEHSRLEKWLGNHGVLTFVPLKKNTATVEHSRRKRKLKEDNLDKSLRVFSVLGF